MPSPAHSHGHVQVALGLPAANAGLLNMKGLSYCASCTLSWHIQRGSTKLSTFRSDVYLVLSRKQYFQQVLHQRAGVSCQWRAATRAETTGKYFQAFQVLIVVMVFLHVRKELKFEKDLAKQWCPQNYVCLTRAQGCFSKRKEQTEALIRRRPLAPYSISAMEQTGTNILLWRVTCIAAIHVMPSANARKITAFELSTSGMQRICVSETIRRSLVLVIYMKLQ